MEQRLRIADFFTEINRVHQNTKCFCALRLVNLHIPKLLPKRVIYFSRKAYDNKNHETIKIFSLKKETALSNPLKLGRNGSKRMQWHL